MTKCILTKSVTESDSFTSESLLIRVIVSHVILYLKGLELELEELEITSKYRSLNELIVKYPEA